MGRIMYAVLFGKRGRVISGEEGRGAEDIPLDLTSSEPGVFVFWVVFSSLFSMACLFLLLTVTSSPLFSVALF